MARYRLFGKGTITRGWDIGSPPYQREGGEFIGKEYYTSIQDARKSAMRLWKDGSVKYSFTSYDSVIIFDGGVMKKDEVGAVKYDNYNKIFFWVSDRTRDPKKQYHGRLINKDGSLSKRSWFDM